MEDQIEQAQRHGGDHAQPSNTGNHRWSATAARVLEPHTNRIGINRMRDYPDVQHGNSEASTRAILVDTNER